ncbi:MAG TPA: preprotein translocase subunit SecE [Candidatus Binataceae bacterium]|nr:preprotein translocase subunit SecE [Candidatus Binataceae bacterium]HVB80098.1 preprotein translocase subunit SecE [Candidatus Binataceae bacterium]
MAKLKNYLEQGVSFVKEAWTELAKVHYPSPKETLQATVVVVILTIVMAIWLGLIDLAATRVVRQLLS